MQSSDSHYHFKSSSCSDAHRAARCDLKSNSGREVAWGKPNEFHVSDLGASCESQGHSESLLENPNGIKVRASGVSHLAEDSWLGSHLADLRLTSIIASKQDEFGVRAEIRPQSQSHHPVWPAESLLSQKELSRLVSGSSSPPELSAASRLSSCIQFDQSQIQSHLVSLAG